MYREIWTTIVVILIATALWVCFCLTFYADSIGLPNLYNYACTKGRFDCFFLVWSLRNQIFKKIFSYIMPIPI